MVKEVLMMEEIKTNRIEVSIKNMYLLTIRKADTYLYPHTNKPPAMQVCSQKALASSKKPPVL